MENNASFQPEMQGIGMIRKALLPLVGMLLLSVLALAVATQSFAADGPSQSAQQLALDKTLNAAKDATWIAEGHGPRLVYIFFDPECPYCHKVYQATRSWIGKDGLQLRWIPVGILMPSSAGKAAAILESKDPLAAFHQNEDEFGPAPKFGGIAEIIPSTQSTKHLLHNAELFKQTRMPGVPVIMFREASGKVHIVDGAPSPHLLNEMFRSVKK
ncbi:MAG: thioredoxin fold domain-containing protein [Sulfuriferula sp.]